MSSEKDLVERFRKLRRFLSKAQSRASLFQLFDSEPKHRLPALSPGDRTFRNPFLYLQNLKAGLVGKDNIKCHRRTSLACSSSDKPSAVRTRDPATFPLPSDTKSPDVNPKLSSYRSPNVFAVQEARGRWDHRVWAARSGFFAMADFQLEMEWPQVFPKTYRSVLLRNRTVSRGSIREMLKRHCGSQIHKPTKSRQTLNGQ